MRPAGSLQKGKSTEGMSAGVLADMKVLYTSLELVTDSQITRCPKARHPSISVLILVAKQGHGLARQQPQDRLSGSLAEQYNQ